MIHPRVKILLIFLFLINIYYLKIKDSEVHIDLLQHIKKIFYGIIIFFMRGCAAKLGFRMTAVENVEIFPGKKYSKIIIEKSMDDLL